MSDIVAPPWRLRCPEGHASIEMYVTGFRCRACGESYPKSALRDFAAEARRDGS